jgi:hypothetical protein
VGVKVGLVIWCDTNQVTTLELEKCIAPPQPWVRKGFQDFEILVENVIHGLLRDNDEASIVYPHEFASESMI